jgi:hypothetical protein
MPGHVNETRTLYRPGTGDARFRAGCGVSRSGRIQDCVDQVRPTHNVGIRDHGEPPLPSGARPSGRPDFVSPRAAWHPGERPGAGREDSFRVVRVRVFAGLDVAHLGL